MLHDEDLLLARLIGDYVRCQSTHRASLADDLLARAAEFGTDTKAKLARLITFYELHRHAQDAQQGRLRSQHFVAARVPPRVGKDVVANR